MTTTTQTSTVSDEAVQAALDKWFGADHYEYKNACFDDMRLTLTAALPHLSQIVTKPVATAIRALSPAEPVPGEPDFSKSIAEVIKEESLGGAACGWKSCTGCLETNEGYQCGEYPYSEVFKTHAGSGCSECGGIGVVWEYYSKADLDEMQRDPIPAEPVDQWQDIATAPKDGTPVLVHDGGSYAFVAEFSTSIKSWFGADNRCWAPTHWMPLPAAPASKGGV